MRALLLVPLGLIGTSIAACGGSSDSGAGGQGGAAHHHAAGAGGEQAATGSGGAAGTSTVGPTTTGTTTTTNATTTTGPTTTAGPGATTGAGGGALVLYGSPYQGGQYNLGPVDYQESQWHNACAPSTKYPQEVQSVEGVFLAGLWDGIPNVAGYCDACIWVTTDQGESAMLRVVTYGDTSTNSIDVSPEAYSALNQNEFPRSMTWQFAECPDTGPMMYEFQTGSSEWWTSLWVRNARVPLAKVEVMSPNHASFTELTRGSDGTLTDASGFGQGSFTIRSTGVDGATVDDTFMWPAGGIAGAFLTGAGNFN